MKGAAFYFVLSQSQLVVSGGRRKRSLAIRWPGSLSYDAEGERGLGDVAPLLETCGGAFGAEASVVLPPDALVCLRLPYVYCEPAGGAALLTAATAAEPAHARRAVLEAGWLKVAN